jgi:hypothetical protein
MNRRKMEDVEDALIEMMHEWDDSGQEGKSNENIT